MESGKGRRREVLRVGYGVFYVVAGTNHFVNPAFYVSIMPTYLPWHDGLVFLSGVAEVLLGAMLCIRRTASLAGWGLMAMLIAIFPANLHMALHPELFPQFPAYALWLRLPLQLPLIAWAWHYARRGAN